MHIFIFYMRKRNPHPMLSKLKYILSDTKKYFQKIKSDSP